MIQGRNSRCVCALLSALAAIAAPALATPASAAAGPAAIDEYDLALPPDDGPADPAPAPEPSPEPAPPAAPTDPTVPVAPAPAGEGLPAATADEAAAPRPQRELDQAAARRDVLFETPAELASRDARSLAAPVEGSSVPPVLWLLFGLGGACIIATLVRLRRFAVALGASPSVVPRSQTSP